MSETLRSRPPAVPTSWAPKPGRPDLESRKDVGNGKS